MNKDEILKILESNLWAVADIPSGPTFGDQFRKARMEAMTEFTDALDRYAFSIVRRSIPGKSDEYQQSSRNASDLIYYDKGFNEARDNTLENARELTNQPLKP